VETGTGQRTRKDNFRSSSRKRNGAEVVTLKKVDLNGDGYGYPIGVLAIAAAVVSTSNTQLSDGFEPDRMGTRAS
jgi:hypothetical protein